MVAAAAAVGLLVAAVGCDGPSARITGRRGDVRAAEATPDEVADSVAGREHTGPTAEDARGLDETDAAATETSADTVAATRDLAGEDAPGSSSVDGPPTAPPPERAYCGGRSRSFALPDDPGAPGPWPVGARTIDVDGLTVEVWYPALPGSEQNLAPHVYDLREHLPGGTSGASCAPRSPPGSTSTPPSSA